MRPHRYPDTGQPKQKTPLSTAKLQLLQANSASKGINSLISIQSNKLNQRN
jgi:hypothetical protein